MAKTVNITIRVPEGYLLESTVAGKVMQWDAANMTNEALLYVLEYGAQRAVNDRTGGKDKTEEEKHKAAQEMIDRLCAETFERRKVREGGGDPLVPFVRGVIRAIIKAADGPAWAAYRDSKEADKRNEMLDAIFAKQSEDKQAAIRVKAEAEKAKADAERKAREESARKLTDGFDLSI